ncbi:unnamed protein product [Pieris macdunnoughi]|uniref:Uncharacterized protein n=1 Tax=Pieris macdunnoughi TaxID=345717 RepID=A0A821S591_9NEOP|nr:unnamed protein product [Pieris macdunnoughi]
MHFQQQRVCELETVPVSLQPVEKLDTQHAVETYLGTTLMFGSWETSVITYKKGDLTRMKMELVSQQSREQAGSLDHIFTLRQIIEKYMEYKKTMYIAFVVYPKAFDIILHNKLWLALRENGIQNKYSNLLENMEKKGNMFQLKRGVRQGVSPNLFTALSN